MALQPISDHVAQAFARLRLQFKDSIDVLGFLAALATEVQAVEDAFNALAAAIRTPSVAVGLTLDKIGALVQAPSRGPRSDTQERGVIATQILVNSSFGRVEDMISIVNASVPTISGPVTRDANDLTPTGFGTIGGDQCITLEPVNGLVSETDLTQVNEAINFLRSASPASVRPILLFQVAPCSSSSRFQFDGSATFDGAWYFYSAIDRAQ